MQNQQSLHPVTPFFANLTPNEAGADAYTQPQRDACRNRDITSSLPRNMTADKYYLGRSLVYRWARKLGKEATPLMAERLKRRNERVSEGKVKRPRSEVKTVVEDEEGKRKSCRLSGTPLEFRILKKGKGKHSGFWDEKYGGDAVLDLSGRKSRRGGDVQKDDGGSKSDEDVDEISEQAEVNESDSGDREDAEEGDDIPDAQR
jgi:hypothetical protein